MGGHSGLGSGYPSACNPNPFSVMPAPPKALDPVSERELIIADMQQLQNAVLDMTRRNSAKPEPVKPGVTSFPVLPEPQSDEGYLLYQDWLVVVSG